MSYPVEGLLYCRFTQSVLFLSRRPVMSNNSDKGPTLQTYEWGCSSVGRASDRHAADAGSIPRCGKGLFKNKILTSKHAFWSILLVERNMISEG